jgi:hypothetical protein
MPYRSLNRTTEDVKELPCHETETVGRFKSRRNQVHLSCNYCVFTESRSSSTCEKVKRIWEVEKIGKRESIAIIIRITSASINRLSLLRQNLVKNKHEWRYRCFGTALQSYKCNLQRNLSSPPSPADFDV